MLRARGLQILVSNTFYSLEEEEAICRGVLGWFPQGVIVAGIDHHEGTRALLRRAGVPVVEALELGETPIDINIGLSHFDAGAAAARHLITRGYRRLGFVGAQMALDLRAQRRRAGFLSVLAEHGLSVCRERLYSESASFDLGAGAAAEFLGEGERIDALFCVNDELAIGTLGECLRRGVRVPHDLAIMGFNDLDISGQVVPGLTTIRSPRQLMGELAAKAILDRLDGNDTIETSIDVGFELVVRDSA